jgi:hypothetical protein
MRLAFYAPQSSDKAIGSELWRGVRVVAAGAARAGALFCVAHVVLRQMVAPRQGLSTGSVAWVRGHAWHPRTGSKV